MLVAMVYRRPTWLINVQGYGGTLVRKTVELSGLDSAPAISTIGPISAKEVPFGPCENPASRILSVAYPLSDDPAQNAPAASRPTKFLEWFLCKCSKNVRIRS